MRALIFMLLLISLLTDAQKSFFQEKMLIEGSWEIFNDSCECKSHCKSINCTGYSLYRFGSTLRCRFATVGPLLASRKTMTTTMIFQEAGDKVFFMSNSRIQSESLDDQEEACAKEGGTVGVIKDEDEYQILKDQVSYTSQAWTVLKKEGGKLVWKLGNETLDNEVTSVPENNNPDRCLRTNGDFTFKWTTCSEWEHVLCMKAN